MVFFKQKTPLSVDIKLELLVASAGGDSKSDLYFSGANGLWLGFMFYASHCL